MTRMIKATLSPSWVWRAHGWVWRAQIVQAHMIVWYHTTHHLRPGNTSWEWLQDEAFKSTELRYTCIYWLGHRQRVGDDSESMCETAITSSGSTCSAVQSGAGLPRDSTAQFA